MFEVGRTIAVCEFGRHTEFSLTCCLEFGDVDILVGIKFAVLEVEECCANELGCCKALVVCCGSLDFGNKPSRDSVAGLPVVSVGTQHPGLKCPVPANL